MKPKAKVYDHYEGIKALEANTIRINDIILYPNIITTEYPDFDTFELWMDKNFEYVVQLNDPKQPVWKYKITGIFKNIKR